MEECQTQNGGSGDDDDDEEIDPRMLQGVRKNLTY